MILHFFYLKMQKNSKKFAHVRKKQYFCTRFRRKRLLAPPLGRTANEVIVRPKSVDQNVGVIERCNRESREVLDQARGGIAQLVRAHDS